MKKLFFILSIVGATAFGACSSSDEPTAEEQQAKEDSIANAEAERAQFVQDSIKMEQERLAAEQAAAAADTTAETVTETAQ